MSRKRFSLLIKVVGVSLLLNFFLPNYSLGGLVKKVIINNIDSDCYPVKAYFIVLDEKNKPIEELKGNDLKVYVDGEELSYVENISGAEGFSLSAVSADTTGSFIVFAFDVSLSMEETLWEHAKRMATSFLERLDSEDNVMLISFGNEVKKEIGFTKDKTLVKKRILALSRNATRTHLYDAVYDTMDVLKSTPSSEKMLLLFTDGIDDGSSLSSDDCVNKVRKSDVPIISLNLQKLGKSSRFLSRLTTISNGLYMDVSTMTRPTDVVQIWYERLKPTYTILLDYPFLHESGIHELTVAVWDAEINTLAGRTTMHFSIPVIPPEEEVKIPWFIRFITVVKERLPWFIIAVIGILVVAVGLTIVARNRIKRRKSAEIAPSGELGEVLEDIRRLHEEAQKLEEQTAKYGGHREEKIRRWRISCFNSLRSIVPVLESLWNERDTPIGSAMYNQLVVNLTTVGLEEIKPELGEKINEENNKGFNIIKKEGDPPYCISKVLYPGYYFHPRLAGLETSEDEILLKPAEVEVKSCDEKVTSGKEHTQDLSPKSSQSVGFNEGENGEE